MSDDFHISPAAAARISHLLASEAEGSYLRVSVEGGGCSGFQYKFDFDRSALTADDQPFGDCTSRVVVDGTSLGFLSGAVLDYVATLGAAAFEIKNPQAKSSCGCGNSFAVAL